MKVQYSESHVIANFCDAHDIGVNQKYAGIHPYSFHLEQTAKFARKFRDLLSPPVFVGKSSTPGFLIV